MKRFNGDWILYLILGAILTILGILIVIPALPLFDIVKDIVKYITGVILIIYALVFLFPIARRKTCKTIMVFRWLELILVIFVAVTLFIDVSGFNFNISKAIAIPIYAYGAVEIIRGYYSDGDVKVITSKGQIVYNRLCKYINIALVTLGTVFFAVEPLKETHVVYGIGIVFILTGLISLFFSRRYKLVPPTKVVESSDAKAPTFEAEEPKEVKEQKIEAPIEKPKKEKKKKANKEIEEIKEEPKEEIKEEPKEEIKEEPKEEIKEDSEENDALNDAVE